MKNVIYDVVVGALIIMSLAVIARLLQTEQDYLVQSASTKTNEEEVYVDEDSKINYNTGKSQLNTVSIADVWGTFTTLSTLNTDSFIEDSTHKIVFKVVIGNVVTGTGGTKSLVKTTYTAGPNSSDYSTLKTALSTAVNDSTYIGVKYKASKDATQDSSTGIITTTYTFTAYGY